MYDFETHPVGAAKRIAELEAENDKLRKGLDIYQRERDRFKHNKP